MDTDILALERKCFLRYHIPAISIPCPTLSSSKTLCTISLKLSDIVPNNITVKNLHKKNEIFDAFCLSIPLIHTKALRRNWDTISKAASDSTPALQHHLSQRKFHQIKNWKRLQMMQPLGCCQTLLSISYLSFFVVLWPNDPLLTYSMCWHCGNIFFTRFISHTDVCISISLHLRFINFICNK